MPGRHHLPPQMAPPQYFANSNLQPANPPPLPHHLLPSAPVTLFHSPPIFRTLYPPGIPYPAIARAPPYPATPRAPPYPATSRATFHPVPVSFADNRVPYSRSNSYPIQQSAGMVSPQQYPGILPHSVGRSPPYRQMSGRQNPPALLPNPPIPNPSHPHTSIADSQTYGAGHNAQLSSTPSNFGLPSRSTSAPLTTTSSRPRDSQHEQRRPPSKRNRQKTTKHGNN